MRIPFDVKWKPQIESGEYKVETKAGCPVRIVCWDMACELPILGLVLLNDEKVEEVAVGFTNEGTNLLGEPLYDELFIVTPEPELTEFERRIKDLLAIKCEIFYNEDIGGCYDLKGLCRVILECAREQLQPEIDAALEKAYRTADEVQYKRGWEDAIEDHREALHVEYEKGRTDALKEIEQNPESCYTFTCGFNYGKEEALKDLPRWKKLGRGNNYSSETKFVINGRYLEMNDTLNDVYDMLLSELEKLPRFKEDEK